MRCDILLTPHPAFAQVLEKLAAREAGKADAFVDPGADLLVHESAPRIPPEHLWQQRVIAAHPLVELLLVELDRANPAMLAKVVDGQVHDDSIQPGVEAGVAFELV